jgi:hypothetical protein
VRILPKLLWPRILFGQKIQNLNPELERPIDNCIRKRLMLPSRRIFRLVIKLDVNAVPVFLEFVKLRIDVGTEVIQEIMFLHNVYDRGKSLHVLFCDFLALVLWDVCNPSTVWFRAR